MNNINNINNVNLYNETEYSLLVSPNRISDLVTKAKEYGYTALGIADLNNVHGLIKFYSCCMENSIKPILGIHTKNDKTSFLFYAKNDDGYRELLDIASISKMNGDTSIINLGKRCNNIITIIPSDESEIFESFYRDDITETARLIDEYRKCFLDSNLYMGLDLQTRASRESIDRFIDFCNSINLKVVAINKTSYIEKEDFEIYRVLNCINNHTNNYPYTEKEMNQEFISPLSLKYRFQKYQELLLNSVKIANECNVTLQFGKFLMPVYFGDIKNTDSYLKELAMIGLKKRLSGIVLKKPAMAYKERLLYELDIITKMGFSDYFLIVYDFIKYAKKNNIYVGPGRGSAPGSLVSFSLGITEIDPLEYDLLFERFLNPERTSMPDIDTDLPDDRRDEVIRYMGEKYGKEKVAHISTFGTFGAKLAIRDVSKVLGLSDTYLDEVLRHFKGYNDTVTSVMENDSVFKRMVNENNEINQLIRIVKKMEGLPRHTSIHAAGIVMADTDLIKYAALQEGMNGIYQTQFEASDLEKLGLVKIDLLGLRNLSIIDRVVQLVKKETNSPNFNIMEIPLDDKGTYKLIATGDTSGMFQLESSGMRSTLIKLKTSSFVDIVNALALFRPGPLEMIPSFVRRKFHEEEVTYIHKDLESILHDTYGTIVFQEQIILIAQKFAGYSLGQADILRRAVSKKNSQTLLSERNRFVQMAKNNHHSEDTSNKVYDYIVKFANYGFNKSHSVAYSLVAYQTAYLKCHYYKCFMSVLMSNSIGSIHLIKSYIRDCNRRNIKVFLPNVNESQTYFTIDDDGIYYSLLGIQNLGKITLDELLQERNKNGKYNNYDEFILRTKDILNKRIVESLINAGACDCFNIPRKQMILEYDTSFELANYGEILKGKLQEHKFGDEEYSFEEIAKNEKEALGFNLKYDLFNQYYDVKKKYHVTNLSDIKKSINKRISILFTIGHVKIIKTKNDEDMAFLEIYDDTASVDGVLFPKIYESVKDKLIYGIVLIGTGRLDDRNNKKQIIFENIFVVK